ncbi:MAG: NifU family protein [Deltaproteobacteria bacterium CG_4_10_14_0_2_um_filter_43_8]|nr:MAG: NifU family protein [Deltaproteobacteria bacterium CG11_big_fil_rev_8_21_14_0_20_42_23]PJA20372.1 MAG: NifU family protein [Deltaproteobacteria bacterium CG_4_10_14_0_2_um_filter_43_8]PJC64159.1 MAG: NifU family protein [Deltaproteobacteria bacterium CG_4_9_14_0_2_um_filter_42_21]
MEIAVQATPNPNTLKFIVNQLLLDSGSIDFQNAEQAQGSPLAEKLFSISNVSGVYVGINFVSVTKTDSSSWAELSEPVVNCLKEIISSGIKLISDTVLVSSHNIASGSENEIEEKIKAILDREIRPAVAMDGGDITFHSYENGIVTLQLRGACSSCPSSTMTLKMGVENRLKEMIPEVKEVVQL